MGALRRTSLEPPATIGVGMALEPRGGTAWAVRSAFLGVAFGVMGLVAVVVFVASVDVLVESPARYGSPFDAASPASAATCWRRAAASSSTIPDVAAGRLGRRRPGAVGGEEVNTYRVRVAQGRHVPDPARRPRARGGAEVVLGTATLEAAGVALGDEVEIEGAAGTLRVTVVGTAVFPVVDERSSPGRGVLLGRRTSSASPHPTRSTPTS